MDPGRRVPAVLAEVPPGEQLQSQAAHHLEGGRRKGSRKARTWLLLLRLWKENRETQEETGDGKQSRN